MFVLLPTLAFAHNPMVADETVDSSQFTPTSQLIDDAIRLTGYARPETPTEPAVLYQTEEEMWNLVCKDPKKEAIKETKDKHCGVFGVTFDHDVIFLRGDVIPRAHDHLLLHEIVHWLQAHSGKFDLNKCEDTILREREAYMIENQYIAEQGGFQFLRMPQLGCPEEPNSR